MTRRAPQGGGDSLSFADLQTAARVGSAAAPYAAAGAMASQGNFSGASAAYSAAPTPEQPISFADVQTAARVGQAAAPYAQAAAPYAASGAAYI